MNVKLIAVDMDGTFLIKIIMNMIKNDLRGNTNL